MTPALARHARRWAESPLAREAAAEVRGALSRLVGAALDAQALRRAEPHRWALFHARMAASLPRWRVFAIAGHTASARRFAALAWTEDALTHSCGATCRDLAEVLGLERP